jgi:hypothetical protein
MSNTGPDYHLARAEREEMLAMQAKDVSSAQAHRQLADLHRAKAQLHARIEPTAA